MPLWFWQLSSDHKVGLCQCLMFNYFHLIKSRSLVLSCFLPVLSNPAFWINAGRKIQASKLLLPPDKCVKTNKQIWGAWATQLVERPTSAQVTISQFVGLSPASGSVLTVQSWLQILSPSLCPSAAHTLSLLSVSLSLKNKSTLKKFKVCHLKNKQIKQKHYMLESFRFPINFHFYFFK